MHETARPTLDVEQNYKEELSSTLAAQSIRTLIVPIPETFPGYCPNAPVYFPPQIRAQLEENPYENVNNLL